MAPIRAIRSSSCRCSADDAPLSIRQVEILRYGAGEEVDTKASSAEVHKVALSAGRYSVASSREQGMLDPALPPLQPVRPCDFNQISIKLKFKTHSWALGASKWKQFTSVCHDVSRRCGRHAPIQTSASNPPATGHFRSVTTGCSARFARFTRFMARIQGAPELLQGITN